MRNGFFVDQMNGGGLFQENFGERTSKRTKVRAPSVGGSSCGICVLAGGLSSRMGRPKASLRLHSRTLLARVRAQADKLGLPLRVIRRDDVPRCGPLGGVYTALNTSLAEAELFLACDMPFVSADLLRKLLESWESDGRPVFIGSGGLAGFPFLIPAEGLAVVAAQISKQQLSLQKLAQALKARLLPAGSREGELFNLNTPADWRAAQRRVGKRSCKSGL